jgi:hypothetical protein
MEYYNELIASHVLDSIDEGIVRGTPQPTMFGGKRMRKFVLPGSTEFDYPGTLSVGSLDGRGADTIGGSFFKDFGHGFVKGFTGTAKAIAPIAVPIAKELLLAKMRGGDYAPSDSDDEMEGGMLVGADGHGINPIYKMADGGIHRGGMPEAGVDRAEGGYFKIGSRSFGKKHGGAMLGYPQQGYPDVGGAMCGGERDPVREYMKTIGSVINPALLVGLGMPGADGHGVRKGGAQLLGADGHGVRRMVPPASIGGASAAERAIGMSNPLLWGYDLGKDVIAPALMKVIPPKRGRGRMVKGSQEAKDHMAAIRAMKGAGGSKASGFIRRAVAEQSTAPPFNISKVGQPSANLQAYAKSMKGKKPRKGNAKGEVFEYDKSKGKSGRPAKYGTDEERYAAKLESNRTKRQERAAAKAGVFESFKAMNPQLKPTAARRAFAALTRGDMTSKYLVGVNTSSGGKSSFLSGLAKAVAPIAKDVIVPVGKELATEFIRNKMRGGKKSSFLSGLAKATAPIAKDIIVPVGKELATEFIRNKMRGGKKSSFLSGLAKAVAPVAKDVIVPVGKELATEFIRNKMRGGATSGGGRAARAAIVKKVMAEMGCSLPQASKYVKEHGLY